MEEEKKEETIDNKPVEEPVKKKAPIGIIFVLIAIILIGVSIAMFIVPSLKKDSKGNNNIEPEKKEPDKPKERTVSIAEAEDLIKSYLNFSDEVVLDPIERYTNNVSVIPSDISRENAFYITYLKHFNNQRTIGFDEFISALDQTFDNYYFEPGNVNLECATYIFEYDSEKKEFNRIDFNKMCAVAYNEAYIHDTYKVLSADIDTNVLKVRVGIYFGKGDKALDHDYFIDYNRIDPDTDNLVKFKKDKSVDTDRTDYSKGSIYEFQFLITNDNYSFISSERILNK